MTSSCKEDTIPNNFHCKESLITQCNCYKTLENLKYNSHSSIDIRKNRLAMDTCYSGMLTHKIRCSDNKAPCTGHSCSTLIRCMCHKQNYIQRKSRSLRNFLDRDSSVCKHHPPKRTQFDTQDNRLKYCLHISCTQQDICHKFWFRECQLCWSSLSSKCHR